MKNNTDLLNEGWKSAGWIANPPCNPPCNLTFQEHIDRAKQSDHGEERLVVIREDGTGADCFYRDLADKPK